MAQTVQLSDEIDQPPAKRIRPNSMIPSQLPKPSSAFLSNPLQIKPLGNLLFRPSNSRTRSSGLGTLAALPDEVLLSLLFTLLDGPDLITMAGVSRVFFAWSHVEGIWKGVYISKTSGRLLNWKGSWRKSYLSTFLLPASRAFPPFPTDEIRTPTLHSDVLFQPSLCASFDACSIFLAHSFTPSIPHIDGRGLTPSSLPSGPAILTGLMDDWAAMSSEGGRRWTLEDMKERFPTTLFRAEATLTSLPEYSVYHENCGMDESPLYLFESHFVEKTQNKDGTLGLGNDYQMPECFREDLFEVMKDERPDYRWLIVGPTRSGSTWHQDPNGTGAWNAVTVGVKAWVMFPPDVTPPGVHVSEDQGEVEAPLSLAEWFLSYYKSAKSIYGSKAKDPSTRGKMREGICSAGEIFYVPSGWWHIVVNLEPAVAVTQNFVSLRELPAVLKFMRDRPEQVSGFKLKNDEAAAKDEGGLGESDDCVAGVFDKFCEALKVERPECGVTVDSAREKMEAEAVGHESRAKRGESMWDKVKEDKENSVGFSFEFMADEEDEASVL